MVCGQAGDESNSWMGKAQRPKPSHRRMFPQGAYSPTAKGMWWSWGELFLACARQASAAAFIESSLVTSRGATTKRPG
eukprot:4378969-Pyramimonas_sp.AAC.1